jgi:transposase
METQPIIVQQERLDDIPLLFGMMQRMRIAEIVDKHLGQHHLHQGLSNGNLVLGWLTYILSQADHRKFYVQEWANTHQQTLQSLFGTPLRPHEFSDDRLGIVLSNLAVADWDDLESDLFTSCFDVYELPQHTFRVDATASCGYHTVEPEGIMQLGHSKDHRPDLPQLKIMAAVTQPLAFLVSSAVAPGNDTDDSLYWSTIVKVKEKVGGAGLLFAGDCKLAALETRARIAAANDYYLTPLPHTGTTAKQLGSWIDTALAKDDHGELQALHKPHAAAAPELIGQGYEFSRTQQAQVDNRDVNWTERVQVVQSLAHWNSQKEKLHKGLRQAEEKLGKLTLSGKGHKSWRQEPELRAAITAIENEHSVGGLLTITLRQEVQEQKKYSKPGRPAETAAAAVAVETRYRIAEVKRNEAAIAAKEKRLGWRALVTNAPTPRLSLAASVLTYREGGGLERPFQNLKGEPLGIRPLWVKLPKQIVGLTRLLLIALRVLTLLEIVIRAKLAASGEKLGGMYEGQKSKLEGSPTSKRTLRAIAGLQLTLSLIQLGEQQWWYLPALPPLLVRVLDLLGLSTSLYTNLPNSCPSPPLSSSARVLPDPSG